MIQYLVILMDDTCPSYCHYQNPKQKTNLISLADLKEGIFFAMKENLMVQYVLPEYELPVEYKEVMNTIDSHLIVPVTCKDTNAVLSADVIVINSCSKFLDSCSDKQQNIVLLTSKEDFFRNYGLLKKTLENVARISVIFTDVEQFTDKDFTIYNHCLSELSRTITTEYSKGNFVQFNLLTDRIFLQSMNSCGAGNTNITLAPDGKFYICPGFYYDGVCDGSEVSQSDVCQKGFSIGSLKDGVNIKNPQLYRLDHAPLCRNCDAYQCKRCIWLNRKTTLEVNTPSHEQCVMAHLERNAARQLLADIRKIGTFLPDCEIPEIDYLDPFDVRKEW